MATHSGPGRVAVFVYCGALAAVLAGVFALAILTRPGRPGEAPGPPAAGASAATYTVEELVGGYTDAMKGKTVRVRGRVASTNPSAKGLLVYLRGDSGPHRVAGVDSRTPPAPRRDEVVTATGRVQDCVDGAGRKLMVLEDFRLEP